MKRLECTRKNKHTNKIENVGYMEIKNQNEAKAELFLYGDIVRDEWGKYSDGDTCPSDITEFLKDLDNSKDIDIFINSGGGSVHGGLAIYNQLKRHNGFKTVHIDGIAASIASVIACAGDKVIIPTNAQFMIHKPSIFTWGSYNAEDLRREANALDVCQESIMNIYENNLKEGVSKEEIEEMVNAETWFTGDYVVNYFNFEVEETAEAVACTSDYYKFYNNKPENLEGSFLNSKKTTMSDEMKSLIDEIKNQKWYEGTEI